MTVREAAEDLQYTKYLFHKTVSSFIIFDMAFQNQKSIMKGGFLPKPAFSGLSIAECLY